MAEQKLDLYKVEEEYEKWSREEESLSGVMNQKHTKNRNIDFRKKLDFWKKTRDHRKRY